MYLKPSFYERKLKSLNRSRHITSLRDLADIHKELTVKLLKMKSEHAGEFRRWAECCDEVADWLTMDKYAGNHK